jgi:dolichol kinase
MDYALTMLAGILLAGTPLLLFEFIYRKYRISAELTRKAVHVLASFAVVLMTFFLNLNDIAIISALFLIFFVVTRKKYIWKSLFQIERKSYGEITFTVGVILARLIAQDEKIFVSAVLIMGVSDTVAAAVGQSYDKVHKLFNTPKTVEGSIGFFLTTVFILALFGVPHVHTALGIAAIITIAELVSKDGLDNITIPLAASLLLNFI